MSFSHTPKIILRGESSSSSKRNREGTSTTMPRYKKAERKPKSDRKPRPLTAYNKFVKDQWKYYHVVGDKATITMKKVAAAWQAQK